MARNNAPAKHSDNPAAHMTKDTKPTSTPPFATIAQLFHGGLAAAQETSDWMVQLQHLFIETTVDLVETLATEMQELQNAKDPWRLVSAQFQAAHQEMDLFARGASATMQQIYDAYLLWIGQWDKTVERAESMDPKNGPDASVFTAYAKAQDQWLQTYKTLVDSLKAPELASGHEK